MTDTTENNTTEVVPDGSNTETNNDLDPSQLQPQPQVRRVFRRQPPRGFRFPTGRNSGARGQGNVGTFVPNAAVNVNLLRHNPLNGNGNANANVHANANANVHANGNRNVQRFRINIPEGEPFMLQQRLQQQQQQRLQQRRLNGSNPSSQQQEQQQQAFTMGQNGSITMGPNGPVQVRMVNVQIDPLAPQPLSASTPNNGSVAVSSDHSGTDERPQDPPDYERFKCEICYEYMNEPAGCGKCASRFCRACLQRVSESDRQNQQAIRCPVCRCEYDEIIPDHELYAGANEENSPCLPCRYVSIGCLHRKVPLSEIAKHELECDHAPLRCRYAHYGCTWTGKRCLLRAHEEFSCKLAPIGPFVEQFRQTKTDHGMRLEMVAQQASGAVRMSHVLRQTYTRDNQRKSLSDVLRLFQYCHAVTSLTPHFLMTKDLWVSYWRNHESRAAVVNFCVFLPFLSATFGVVAHGSNDFFQLFEEAPSGKTLSMLAMAMEAANATLADVKSPELITAIIKKLQNSQTEELLENTFLGVCAGTLGLLVIMLTFVDTKSNVSWDKISLPYFGGKYPLVGDAVGISVFTLLLAIMEYHQADMRAKVIWMAMIPTSTFFPAMILSISHNTARLVTGTPTPASFNMMKMARLVEPCMFGLRFSFLTAFLGILPMLDASVALSLVPQTSRMYLKHAFLDYIPRSACFFYLSARSSFWGFRMKSLLFDSELDWTVLKSAVTVESANEFFTSSSDGIALSRVFEDISSSVLATAALMITCFIINNFFSLGISVGDYISLTSQKELNPEGIARGTAKEYSLVGLFAFGAWAMMNVLLVYI